jgi:hypothetical protein
MEFDKNLQIEILESVKDQIRSKRDCLCELIRSQIQKKIQRMMFYTEIREFIPLFTYENAVKHADALAGRENKYWWSYWDFDFENRIKFLDWMIGELKK